MQEEEEWQWGGKEERLGPKRPRIEAWAAMKVVVDFVVAVAVESGDRYPWRHSRHRHRGCPTNPLRRCRSWATATDTSPPLVPGGFQTLSGVKVYRVVN